MNEYLILRLASQSEQPMPWLVWSRQEAEVIASGEIASADRLHELQSRAAGRELIALVPSVDCAIRQMPLPRKNRRQALAALPYMLEDELAEDVEDIHWSCYLQGPETADVAYLSQSKMESWLTWLAEAGLSVSKFVPEALALPVPTEEQWQLAQLHGNWLIRQSQHQAFALDGDANLQLWLQGQDFEEIELLTHTPWPEALAMVPAQVELAELPLAALIQGAIDSPCNLRVGEYKDQSSKPVQPWQPWLRVAALAGVALLLYVLSVGLQLAELKTQEQSLKDDIVATYKLAFPNAKSSKNLKAVMRQELKKIGESSTGEGGLLTFLHEFAPAYQSVKGIQIESLRFDNKRGELRIQASASGFQSFEQLKGAIQSGYSAELGALNSNDGQVNGTIIMRRAS